MHNKNKGKIRQNLTYRLRDRRSDNTSNTFYNKAFVMDDRYLLDSTTLPDELNGQPPSKKGDLKRKKKLCKQTFCYKKGHSYEIKTVLQ